MDEYDDILGVEKTRKVKFDLDRSYNDFGLIKFKLGVNKCNINKFVEACLDLLLEENTDFYKLFYERGVFKTVKTPVQANALKRQKEEYTQLANYLNLSKGDKLKIADDIDREEVAAYEEKLFKKMEEAREERKESFDLRKES